MTTEHLTPEEWADLINLLASGAYREKRVDRGMELIGKLARMECDSRLREAEASV